jgi:hypothetical protein
MEIEMNNAPQTLTLCDYVAMALLVLIAGAEVWTMCLTVIDRRKAAQARLAATAKDEQERTQALLAKLDEEQAAGREHCELS